MIINFEKIDQKWYVINEDYEGDPEDLEMVEGSDVFLNCITTDNLYASIEVFDEEPKVGDYFTLELLNHDELGATYKVLNCDDYSDNVWLCNVAHLYFNGEHPERIYLKINDTL